MSKLLSQIVTGLLLLFLGLSMVNKSLEAKYGQINHFYSPLKVETNIGVKRECNEVIISIYDKKVKIPIIIELPNPLLRK